MKFLTLSLVILLTACGGGSDTDTTPVAANQNTSTVSPSILAAPSAATAPNAVASVFRVINQNTKQFNTITNYGVADLNKDGLDDVVIGGGANSNGINFITILIQNSDGTLTDRTTELVGDNKIGGGGHVLIADFDHDGYMDIYIPGGDDFHIEVASVIFWGSASGKFTRQSLGALSSHGACLADLNSDGHVDMLIAGAYNQQTNNSGYFLNNGNRTFSTMIPSLDINGASSCAVIRDIVTGHLAVLQGGNNQMAGYESSISIVDASLNLIKRIGITKRDTTVAGLIAAVPVDINGDGLVDLVLAWESMQVGWPNRGRKEVWMNQGNDNFVYGYTLDTAHNMPGDWISFTYLNELYVFFDAPGGDAVLYRSENGKLVPYKTDSFSAMLTALGADPVTGAWSGAHAVASATVYRGRDGIYMLQKLASGLYTKKL
jgi:FG-GAP-like repeat